MSEEVRFVDDERVDIPDATDLQLLVYEYCERFIGAIMGPHGDASVTNNTNGGVLSTGNFSPVSTPTSVTLDIPEGAYYRGEITGSANRRTAGRTVRHDPTLPSQLSSLDLTGFEAAQQLPYIWAARIQIDTDVDSRRKWDTGISDEVSFSLATRRRERVAFQASLTKPSGPWFTIAQVTSWNAPSGGNLRVPNISLIHAFDANVGGDDVDDLSRRVTKVLDPNSTAQVGEGHAHVGLARIVSWILNEILQIKSAGAGQWTDAVSLGLDQLAAITTVLDAYRVAEIAYLDTGKRRLLAHGWVDHDGSSYDDSKMNSTNSFARVATGVGRHTITVGGEVKAVQASPKHIRDNGVFVLDTDTIVNVGRVTYTAGSNTSQFEVFVLDVSAAAGVDQGFHLCCWGAT